MRAVAILGIAALLTPVSSRAETREAIAGRAEYDTSRFHRVWFGEGHRELWTTPVAFEVLDLGGFAGGLTPVRRVGSFQSLGLALRGADGRAYTFRVLDKDPTQMLPPAWRDSLPAEILQDQTAMSHPGSDLVVPVLAEAGGIPHTRHRLVSMPDDPRLGDLRALFAGRTGTFYEYPLAASGGSPGFLGATEILDTQGLWRAWLRGEGAVDRRALLRARLLDLLVGDWDRHAGQWRWMRRAGSDALQPLPEDRDQALSSFDGRLAAWARTFVPQLVPWRDDYEDLRGLLYQGREVDRWHLNGLERRDFAAVARELQSVWTDDAIAAAVGELPEPWRALEGESLETDLKRRRDALTEAAVGFYEQLAGFVDVQGTDRADLASLTGLADGRVQLTLTLDGADAPYFERRFDPEDTREIRLYLRGGDDVFRSQGGEGDIRIRVSAGKGTDRLDDSAGGGTLFYDLDAPDEVVAGRGTHVVRRAWEEATHKPTTPWMPQQDYGSLTRVQPLVWWEPDPGVVVAVTAQHYRYGFRKRPYSTLHVLGLAFKTARLAIRAAYDGDFVWAAPGFHSTLHASIDGAKTYNFYGFGNETSDDGDEKSFEADQRLVHLFPAVVAWESPKRSWRMGVGPELKSSHDLAPDGSLIDQLAPYGAGDFGQLGARLSLRYDARGRRVPEAGGEGYVIGSGQRSDTNLRLWLDAAWYPEAWDVTSSFGSLQGTLVGTWQVSRTLTLAARAGGRQVWGDYPWYEAAFLGGADDVRGYDRNRFAGDASLFGSAEVRLTFGQLRFLVPARWGLFGFAESGRVWLEGEDSRRWHPAYGGGIFFRLEALDSVVRASAATGDEGVRIYVGYGFSF